MPNKISNNIIVIGNQTGVGDEENKSEKANLNEPECKVFSPCLVLPQKLEIILRILPITFFEVIKIYFRDLICFRTFMLKV